ncbi:hypothetical protein BSKO_08178 [Bryopsis sp. KO-2023]|nr:hypothetical protein BSKO_08178 [Bryopsis sp. KO-2023]
MPPAYVRKGYSLIRVDPTKGKDGPPSKTLPCAAGSSKAIPIAEPDAGERTKLVPPCVEISAEVGAPAGAISATSAPPCGDTFSESESDAEVKEGPDIVVPPIWRHLSFKEFFGSLLYDLEGDAGRTDDDAFKNGGDGEPRNRVRGEDPSVGENEGIRANLEKVYASPTPAFVRVETVHGARSDGDASDTSSVSGNWEVYESDSSEDDGNTDDIDEKAEATQTDSLQKAARPNSDDAKPGAPPSPSEQYYYKRLRRNQIVRQGLENGGSNGVAAPVQPSLNGVAAPVQPSLGSGGGSAGGRSRSPPSLVRMGTKLYRSQYTNHSRKLERVHNKITRCEEEVGGAVAASSLCTSYQKSGVCKWGSGCRYKHDADKVAVCPAWLHGDCERKDCKLQHATRPDLMPNCIHYLNDRCHRSDCPYSHADIDSKAPLCSAFSLGYCPNGSSCPKKHFTPKMLAEMLGSVEEAGTSGKRPRGNGGDPEKIARRVKPCVHGE